MLFLKVDASDFGWGACAYQMVKLWDGDPSEQARIRVNDTSTGARKIIEWVSKSWNEHELKIVVSREVSKSHRDQHHSRCGTIH
jgi:hypothetical protein